MDTQHLKTGLVRNHGYGVTVAAQSGIRTPVPQVLFLIVPALSRSFAVVSSLDFKRNFLYACAVCG